MKPELNYVAIDAILNMFFGHLPYGANYFTLTYRLNLNAEEWEAIFDFLIDEGLIEPWSENDKQIISEKGICLIKSSRGIESYVKSWDKMK